MCIAYRALEQWSYNSKGSYIKKKRLLKDSITQVLNYSSSELVVCDALKF